MRTLTTSLLALAACALIAGCGDKAPEQSTKSAAASSAAKAAPPASVTVGKVFVAPVSKIASAPGIDPMKASTLPPMPMSARASGPAGAPLALNKKS